MKIKFFIFLFFSFNIILTQSENSSSNINTNTSESKEDSIDYTSKLNLTIDEMDKMLLCSIFIQKGLSKDKDRIEALITKINIQKDNHHIVFDKIGADLFENCYKDIDITTVRKYFYNLTKVNKINWDTKYDKYVEIDYDKYLTEKNFNLTEEQQMLSIKFNAVAQKWNKIQMEQKNKKEENDDNDEEYKIKIGNFDINNVPHYIKGIIFVAVFGIIFFGAIYLLSKLVNKPKKVKQKKKKNI